MPPPRHILINALSIGSAGGLTVGRELLTHLAAARPEWAFTLALLDGHPLHADLAGVALPANARLLGAPADAVAWRARRRYERGDLVRWADRHDVSAVLQLNGSVIPGLRRPTLAHHQDPWPYRPEAWGGPRERVVAFLKRRAHARSLREAASVGFTSEYLRDLICGRLCIRPRRADVFYNGLPAAWIDRARRIAGGAALSNEDVPRWDARPVEMVSVSHVSWYKRQALVIEALPHLLRRPGLAGLVYRIVGEVAPDFRHTLVRRAESLGVGGRVVIEGRVGDARVSEVLAGARCFVLMSVCESFGIPAVEAMSWGTPVVTSDCCAMPEVCGGAAELCPVDDLPALVERLVRVLTDPARAAELSRLGAERAQRFTWRETAGRMAECLEEIAGSA